MKIIPVLLLLLAPFAAGAQVGGEIATDQRKIVSDISYSITGHQTGVFVFNISVDMEGAIVSCVQDKKQSTLISTPLMMKAKNQVLTGLRFERGYHFPEYHSGTVTIRVILEE